MALTQEHLPVADIKEDILLLKSGGGAMILQVSAVNFGLLSQKEQMAIIGSFAQMLNSLSFSIQIVIHSERLNISSYLDLLDQAKTSQVNPLLANLMASYRQFIQTTIKENEVLDKKFYIVIPLFALEVGLTANIEALWQKVKTTLIPRRDQVVRQLSRIGLKANQLTNIELIKLFYRIYNNTQLQEQLQYQPQLTDIRLKNPSTNIQKPTISSTATFKPAVQSPAVPSPVYNPPIVDRTRQVRTHPFVVEELSDNI
ncbi:MAG: hypothetical protein Q8P92_04655 [Candidatus Daviesbacteria bacterium]|nr:hypothetical protein [Candidatus Daviesbacteria bacterium]